MRGTKETPLRHTTSREEKLMQSLDFSLRVNTYALLFEK